MERVGCAHCGVSEGCLLYVVNRVASALAILEGGIVKIQIYANAGNYAKSGSGKNGDDYNRRDSR